MTLPENLAEEMLDICQVVPSLQQVLKRSIRELLAELRRQSTWWPQTLLSVKSLQQACKKRRARRTCSLRCRGSQLGRLRIVAVSWALAVGVCSLLA